MAAGFAGAAFLAGALAAGLAAALAAGLAAAFAGVAFFAAGLAAGFAAAFTGAAFAGAAFFAAGLAAGFAAAFAGAAFLAGALASVAFFSATFSMAAFAMACTDCGVDDSGGRTVARMDDRDCCAAAARAAAAALGSALGGGFGAMRLPVGLCLMTSLPVRASSISWFAASSSTLRAYMSSLTSTRRARSSICISPGESRASCCRRSRLRTTSASSRMSPLRSFSWLRLKRWFHWAGISLPAASRTASTSLTARSLMTGRRPAVSAFSHGTITVIGGCRISIVRYSRRSPRISWNSLASTVPAPWCG